MVGLGGVHRFPSVVFNQGGNHPLPRGLRGVRSVPSVESMSHSLLLWNLYFAHACPVAIRVRSQCSPESRYVLPRGLPTRCGFPRPQSYLTEGFPLCISYEVLGRSATQPRAVPPHAQRAFRCASHTRSCAWPLVLAPPRASLYCMPLLDLFIDRAGCNHSSAGGIKGVGKHTPSKAVGTDCLS